MGNKYSPFIDPFMTRHDDPFWDFFYICYVNVCTQRAVTWSTELGTKTGNKLLSEFGNSVSSIELETFSKFRLVVVVVATDADLVIYSQYIGSFFSSSI